MRFGAVLIATGKHTTPMLPSGDITVAQRMIATLQKAGVTQIAVVTGPDDKKMEKQLAQYGVFFLQNPDPELEGNSIALGITYLSSKCDRIYLLTADFPLVSPGYTIGAENCGCAVCGTCLQEKTGTDAPGKTAGCSKAFWCMESESFHRPALRDRIAAGGSWYHFIGSGSLSTVRSDCGA